MGFKKYYKKQKKRFIGAVKKRYAPSGKLDIARVVKDVAYVKSVLNVERKFVDLSFNSSVPPLGSNWNLYELLQIPQGNGVSNRNGNSVRLKSIQMRGSIKINAANTLPQVVRIVFFIDKEPGVTGVGLNPAATELYTGNLVSDMRNYDSILQKRFTVLRTMYIKLDGDYPQQYINFYKKMHLPVKWTSTSTVADAIQQNAVYMVISSDVSGANLPIFDFKGRVTYVDN